MRFAFLSEVLDILVDALQEDEDGLTDSDDEEEKPKKYNFKWQKAVVKDLADLRSSNATVKRRHSISNCDTVLKSEARNDVGVLGSICNTSPIAPTLNLSLCEVGHIRSVLVKAEIEVCYIAGLCQPLKHLRVCSSRVKN